MPLDKKRILKNVFGWLIAGLIFYILFKTIYSHRAELSQWKWRIDWFNAAVSVITLMAAYLCGSQGWRAVIAGFGIKIKLHEAFRVVYLANLGRYIPGKVWQVVGMVGLAKEVQVPPQVALASFALVQGYALPAAFLLIPATLGLDALPKSMEVMRDILYLFMTATVLLFLFLFFKPDGLNWALNKILKLFRQEPVQYRPSLQNRLEIFLWYLLNWTLFGISFHFFLRALLADTSLPFIYSTGAYITGYILGYIAFLSPAGLGIREGVLSAVLAVKLGGPLAASIAIINRVWITIAEVIITLLALGTYQLKRHNKPL